MRPTQQPQSFQQGTYSNSWETLQDGLTHLGRERHAQPPTYASAASWLLLPSHQRWHAPHCLGQGQTNKQHRFSTQEQAKLIAKLRCPACSCICACISPQGTWTCTPA